MVKLRKGLSAGHGINAWVQQKLTALVMLIAIIVLAAFVIYAGTTVDSSVESWKTLFNCVLVKVFIQVVIMAVILHAWIGMRDVIMDYVKCFAARTFIYTLLALWLAGSLVYSAVVLWA